MSDTDTKRKIVIDTLRYCAVLISFIILTGCAVLISSVWFAKAIAIDHAITELLQSALFVLATLSGSIIGSYVFAQAWTNTKNPRCDDK